MPTLKAVMLFATICLAGCTETVQDKIKKEGEHFEFLYANDGSQKEKCASMKRLRDLNAEARDDEYYRTWSERIEQFCKKGASFKAPEN